MTLPKIEERTLYPSIIEYLGRLGFKAVGESSITKKHPDILFEYDSTSFVIEVKIGTEKVGLSAVAQAFEYARRLKTQNIIILIYPEKYRNQIILDTNIVSRIALDEEIEILMLTEFWTEKLKDVPKNAFERLRNAISIEKIRIDFDTVVKLIETYVEDLNSIVYQLKTEELISEVVDKLDLFSAIGNIKDKELAKRQVMNLATYLLFNQLLFYHIYERKTKEKRIDELEEVSSVKEIQHYFDTMTKIDYKSIYRVNILGHIPEKKKVLETLNEVIKGIKVLRAEHITHDLAGRFFHDLIPFEVRKILAAFYTHPIAAEILAGLTIDSWDATVIDPACGSGTLLVAAYRRKQQLYQEWYGLKDLEGMHKKFIENDLTGIDIMPFAAHLTTVNLSTQNIERETNKVRIGTRDSLEIAPLLKQTSYGERGIQFSPYTEAIQEILEGISDQIVEKGGVISPEGKGEEFYLKPVDVTIMNPPFSDRNKMPIEMREKLKKNKFLIGICGNAVNLWGYFLALSHLLLKEGKKVGCVIPINIARGETTKKIRTLFFENYHVKFIVKSVGDLAFSEGASFKDVLLIAEKTEPKTEDLTGIVFLKRSIKTMNFTEARKVVETMRKVKVEESEPFENEYFSLRYVRQSEMNKRIDNLMWFLFGISFENADTLRAFVERFTELGCGRLCNLELDMLKEGITSPEGFGELVYITRPSDESRVKRAFLVLEDDSGKNISACIKDCGISVNIPRKKILPALRTLTGIKKVDIIGKYDYITKEDYPDFRKVQPLSRWKGAFNWNIVKEKIERLGYSRLIIPDKINVSSPNTSLLCCYSETPLVLSNLFYTYKILEESTCKILSLSLNSVLTLSQFIIFKSETLGSDIRLSADDWNLTFQIDPHKLSDEKKQELLNFFNTLRTVEFPSITEQLEKRFWARVELDRRILEILGFTDKEINEWLPRVYGVLVQELRAMKEIT